jgi:hypothetical protein
MRFDDLELGTQALVLVNTLLAVVIINILLILRLLVGISFRNLPTRSQLFGTIVILYVLVHTFPAGGATWMDNFGLRKRFAIAACNSAWLTCHGATAVAFADRVADCFGWYW